MQVHQIFEPPVFSYLGNSHDYRFDFTQGGKGEGHTSSPPQNSQVSTAKRLLHSFFTCLPVKVGAGGECR